jgi:hypothetical protein
MLAQPLPGTGRLALQSLLEQARLPTWRLSARDAAIEKKDTLMKASEALRGLLVRLLDLGRSGWKAE